MNKYLKGAVLGFTFVTLTCATSAPVTAHSSIVAIKKASIKKLIVLEASNMGVPASLALAVAHAESNFNHHAKSPKGARGVMQIMPSTAMGEYGIEADRLWEPRINIRLGLHYLEGLIRRYNGRINLALSFYNGGSAVGNPKRAKMIPATYPYIRKVRKLQSIYRVQLYGNRPNSSNNQSLLPHLR
jgi:soluble lytic murein transglycosylase-like protein